MSFIINMTKTTIQNGLLNFAKELGSSPKDVQLVISAKDTDGLPKYSVLSKYKHVKEVTFKQILNKKIDMLNREAVAEPFLQKALQNISKQSNIDLMKLKVMIISTDQKADNLKYFIYDDFKLVKEITIEHIFGEEDLFEQK